LVSWRLWTAPRPAETSFSDVLPFLGRTLPTDQRFSTFCYRPHPSFFLAFKIMKIRSPSPKIFSPCPPTPAIGGLWSFHTFLRLSLNPVRLSKGVVRSLSAAAPTLQTPPPPFWTPNTAPALRLKPSRKNRKRTTPPPSKPLFFAVIFHLGPCWLRVLGVIFCQIRSC